MTAHTYQKKIYYHDTDCGGVVYYANYLKHLEEARTEFFTDRGYSLCTAARRGIFFVVGHVDIRYKAPAHYQDVLIVTTTVERVRSASVVFIQQIAREGTVLVEAQTTLVCVNREFHSQPIPAELKEVLLS